MQESSLTPQKVIALLQKKGIELTIEEATAIISFLRAIANIVVAQYLREDNN